MRRSTCTLVLFALGVLISSACGPGGIGGGDAPSAEVSSDGQVVGAGGTISFLVPQVAAGTEQVVARISVANTGNGALELYEATLDATPAGSLLLVPDTTPTADAPVVVAPAEGEEVDRWEVDVVYVGTGDGVVPTGTLTIHTNYTLEQTDVLTVALEGIDGPPVMSTSPPAVTFGTVGQGETAEQPLHVLNTGQSDLAIDRIVVGGHPGFALVVDGVAYPVDATTSSEGLVFDPPLLVPFGTQADSLAVRFAPAGAEAAEGTLVLHANDPQHPNGLPVPLSANADAPCIVVSPAKVDFGARLVGDAITTTVDVASCGVGELVIDEATLTGAITEPFSFAPTGGASWPVTLGVGQTLSLDVTYTALELSALDAEGQLVPDTAELVLSTNTWAGDVVVPLSGFGVDTICPTPVIIVQEGEEVIPQTVLHLIGEQSFGTTAIATYQWTVEQPVGSTSAFLPSASAPNPIFEANVSGLYVFHLQVTDANGDSCDITASYTVLVQSDDAIHVELLWSTPGDPDETDEGPEAGADLDLHFAHPFASHSDLNGDGVTDPWFDIPFDCFWFNKHPNWGSLTNPADDANLDRDDTDGAGPENVNLAEPEDGLTYRIGVHYWNDHGFGPSEAVLRIYLYGTLEVELVVPQLTVHDFWDAATVAWPSGVISIVTDDEGGLDITPHVDIEDFMGQ